MLSTRGSGTRADDDNPGGRTVKCPGISVGNASARTGVWSSMNVWLYLLTLAHLVVVAVVHGEEGGGEGEREVRSGRRTCRLYCRVGIGFHLQIHSDGRINGSHQADPHSILELFAVSQGVIGIRGVHSNRFLAMNNRGRLHATMSFTDDCKFRERFQENSYTTYASVLHWNRRTGRQWFVALNKRGKAKMGSSPRVKAKHVSTHFLPRVGFGVDGESGFAVTEQKVDQRRVTPAKEDKTKVQVGTQTRQVKYWPKYRFG
ncbi:fibroblast growth factor 5 [Stigmatopora nigra]